MTQIKLTSTRQNWDGILSQTRTRVGQIVRKTALDAQAAAQAASPVDTGALRASIYTASFGASVGTNAQVSVQATAGKAALFPPYELTAAFQAAVVVGAEYGYWVEVGTTRRPARPFLLPAIEDQQGPFVKALQVVLSASDGANLTLSPSFAQDIAAGSP